MTHDTFSEHFVSSVSNGKTACSKKSDESSKKLKNAKLRQARSSIFFFVIVKLLLIAYHI